LNFFTTQFEGTSTATSEELACAKSNVQTHTVWHVEDDQSDIESITSEIQILDQPINFRIADVTAVNESEQPITAIRTVRPRR
jgi:hypothetical protein